MTERNLDRRIAELMGYAIVELTNHVWIIQEQGAFKAYLSAGWFPRYSPSTSLLEAFHVVDRMRGMGWEYFQLSTEISDVWIARFKKAIEENWISGGGYVESAPEAICRAALVAFEKP